MGRLVMAEVLYHIAKAVDNVADYREKDPNTSTSAVATVQRSQTKVDKKPNGSRHLKSSASSGNSRPINVDTETAGVGAGVGAAVVLTHVVVHVCVRRKSGLCDHHSLIACFAPDGGIKGQQRAPKNRPCIPSMTCVHEGRSTRSLRRFL